MKIETKTEVASTPETPSAPSAAPNLLGMQAVAKRMAQSTTPSAAVVSGALGQGTHNSLVNIACRVYIGSIDYNVSEQVGNTIPSESREKRILPPARFIKRYGTAH